MNDTHAVVQALRRVVKALRDVNHLARLLRAFVRGCEEPIAAAPLVSPRAVTLRREKAGRRELARRKEGPMLAPMQLRGVRVLVPICRTFQSRQRSQVRRR